MNLTEGDDSLLQLLLITSHENHDIISYSGMMFTLLHRELRDYTHMEISRLRQPCSKVAATLQGCSKLVTTLHQPLQGAHNLVIILCKVHTTLQKLYISCTTLHDGCKVVHDGCKVVVK